MKSRPIFVCIVFILLVSAAGVSAQENGEVALYDRYGKPIAYLAPSREHTIYLYDGTPVAYLLVKGDLHYIYGFNGKHIGWFEQGLIRDFDGDVVACEKDIINMVYEVEPLKSLKKDTPFRKPVENPRPKPTYRERWSQLLMSVFLQQGIEKTDAAKMRR